MMNARRLAALLPFLCLAAVPARAVDLDAGLRASIYDDSYKLGKGVELGVVDPLSPVWDLGVHLNYSYYTSKIPETLKDASEFGGYVALYFRPALDQDFSLRIGPHIGYAKIENHFADVGGDAMAVFKATPTLSFYGAFIPSFLIGKGGESLFRVGLGVEYSTGK